MSGTSGLPQAKNLGVYAMQALTDRDIAEGQDAPHARLSREIETRARIRLRFKYTGPGQTL